MPISLPPCTSWKLPPTPQALRSTRPTCAHTQPVALSGEGAAGTWAAAKVADLVWTVTKPPASDTLPTEKAARWKAQRLAMLEHLDPNHQPVLRLKAADALANLKAVYRDLGNPAVGEAIWQRFKVGREVSLWYYQMILEKVQAGLGDEPLVQELNSVLNSLNSVSKPERVEAMNSNNVIAAIKTAFNSNGNPCKIPKRGGYFTARLTAEGIEVDNLGSQPLLPWAVFAETIKLLQVQGGKAKKGNAMKYKLGDAELGLDTIEGYISHKVYRQQKGESVFRRVTPIANILVWADVCQSSKGYLSLK